MMRSNLLTSIHSWWEFYPLRTIIILALVLRLIAAIFSQGYGMHDDHFFVIETPWSWTQGMDFEGCLPASQITDPEEPILNNLFYSGINYLQFSAMNWLGITDSKIQMIIIRLLLALLSLVTVILAYRIALEYTNLKTARQVGLLLAVYWFMPFFAVRNLVEAIVSPVLIAGVWYYIKAEKQGNSLNLFVLAGIISAFAVSIRYQIGVYLFCMVLAILIQKKYRNALIFGFSALLSFLLLQAILDILIYGKPFAQTIAYIGYNLSHKMDYGSGNYLMYVELILGLLLPPLSVFIFFGFFKAWKKYLMLFLPTFGFLLFHTLYPNRQERFILTIVPFVIMLGIMGWNKFYENSRYWEKRQRLYRRCLRVFWTINIILLIPVSISYSKKSRVEVMYYFKNILEKNQSILVEDTRHHAPVMLPIYYSGKTAEMIVLTEDSPIDTNYVKLSHRYYYKVQTMTAFEQENGFREPSYLIFVEDTDLEDRVKHMKTYYPEMQKLTTIHPSLVDRIMKRMNPINRNEIFFVYSTGL